MLSPPSDPGFASHPVHGLKAQLPFIQQVVKLCKKIPFRCALDVGAHIGIWSLELSRHFEEVHAFEPVEENRRCLEQNTKGRPVTSHACAVGEQSGFCNMWLAQGGNSGMWQVDPLSGKVPAPPAKHERMRSLDSYWFKDVCLIKIDTEGFEGQVILGARRTIEESKPVIVIEDNGLGPKTYGKDWVEPKPLLLRLGYTRAIRVRKDEVWVPSP
jgi:FkbM family methyltransferase